MLALTRRSDAPIATIEHREGKNASGKLLTEIRVEEIWTTNLDGEAVCEGLRVNFWRGESWLDERIELVLP